MLRGLLATLLILAGGLLLFIGLVGGGAAGWTSAPGAGDAREPRDASCLRCKPVLPAHRVVLVLVDGLRHRSVFRRHSEFHYVNDMLRLQRCHAAMSLARPPTVTLPRIKSLMSGKLSVFTDLLFNFFGRTVEEDSVLLQAARRHGKSLVVHGDDTWVRTWAGLFDARSDEVRSFFVSDYTEVDDNVTRHIIPELTQRTDWDLLVLHYLGIDHIGHYLGPKSPVMDAKEREMDGVLRILHQNLPQDAVLLAVSDHGMTSSGNHGGSAADEVETVLLAMGPPGLDMLSRGASVSADMRNPSTIQQIDVAVTLAMLWNVTIPSGNAGVFWPALFTQETFRDCAECNAHQLRKRAGVDVTGHPSAGARTDEDVFRELDRLSEELSEQPGPQMLVAGAGVVVVLAAHALASRGFSNRWVRGDTVLPSVMAASCFASTYAEEFHCVVHYLAATHLILLLGPCAATRDRARGGGVVCVLVLLRLMFSWTQSGILALTNPTEHPRLADYFKAREAMHIPQAVLWGFGFMVLVWSDRSVPWTAVRAFSWSVQFIAHADVSREVEVAVRWVGVACAVAWLWKERPHGMNLAALACCVAPPEDAVIIMLAAAVPFLLASFGDEDGALRRRQSQMHASPHDLSVWLAALCAQTAPGRSISLGHLNFSPAYSAVLSYHPLPLAVLILLIHFAALIVVLVPYLHRAGVRRLAIRFAVLNVLASAAAAWWFHSHIFIWTVFTPKLLFSILDALATFLLCMPFC